MEDYIIRIYQRVGEHDAFAGIVEIVGKQEMKSFKSREELLAILKMARAGSTISWE